MNPRHHDARVRAARRGALVPALLAATAVVAQDAPDAAPPDEPLEVVIVTATKRETALATTPLAITALSQEDLLREGVFDIADLQDFTPGLIVAENGRNGAVQLTLRGIYSSNDTEFGSPAVGFHQDGVYSPRPTAGFAMLYDVERVEILRGPQGTLYGRNSTVGTINVISKRPDLDEWGAFLEYGAGNYSAQSVRATLNAPLLEDKLAVRFNFALNQQDGWVHQLFDQTDFDGDGQSNVDQRRNREVGEDEYYYNQDSWGLRAAALYEPADWLTLYAAYDRFVDDSAGSVPLKDCDLAAGTPAACADGTEFEPLLVNVPGERDGEDQLFRLVTDVELGEILNLSYLYGYQDLSHNPVVDVDGGQGRFTPWTGRFDAAGAPVLFQNFGQDRYLQWTDTVSRSQSHELQVKSPGNQRLDWIVGVFRFEEEGRMRQFNEEPTSFGFNNGGIINGPFVFNFQTDDIEIASEAAFAQVDFEIAPDLNLTAGVRHTRDEIDYGFQAAYTNSNPPRPDLYFDPERPTPADGGQWYEAEDFETATRAVGEYPFNNSVEDGEGIEFSKTTWRLGFDYVAKNLRDTFFYGYAATGYRQGNLTIPIPRTFVNFVPTEFYEFKADPEEVLTFELGIKGSYFDDALDLRLAVYRSDYESYQVFDFVDARFDFFLGPPNTPVLVPLFSIITNPLVTQNVGDVRFHGVELDYALRPWPNGRLSGHLVWGDNEIESFAPVAFAENWFCDIRNQRSDLTDCAADASLVGNRLVRTPEWTGSLTYQHRVPLGRFEIEPRATLTFSSSFYHSMTNFEEGELTSKEGGFENVNAGIRFTGPDGRWYVDLWGDNLTDEQHKIGQNVAPGRAGNTGNMGFVLGEFTPPRTYGVRVGARF